MLRLALILCAAIYAGLVILSERTLVAPDGPETVGRAATIDVTQPVVRPPPDHFLTADGRSLLISAVIDPVALARHQIEIAHISTRRADDPAETLSASASEGLPETLVIEVTGSAVNLRAGPSTGDAVLTALVRGDQAELIGAPGNGWVQVRTLSGGTIGYMSDRFITPRE